MVVTCRLVLSAEQQAELDGLEAEKQRLFAEYQAAFADGSGKSKAEIAAASNAYAAAQKKAKAFQDAAAKAAPAGSPPKGAAGRRAGRSGNRAARSRAGGGAAADLLGPPLEPLGAPAGAAAPAAAGDKTVKGYLQNRGLSEWYHPLARHENVVRVSQLAGMTVNKLKRAAEKAGKELDDAAAEDIVQRLKMS